MTTEEISCYELAYQIRRYMDICHIDESQFAETISIPCEELTHFLAYHKSSFSISQISKICDTLYISMDSLVRGPVEEENFAVLLKRCAFVGKLKGTALYNVCMFFLKRWRERRISDSCLERSPIFVQSKRPRHGVRGIISALFLLPSVSPERFRQRRRKS